MTPDGPGDGEVVVLITPFEVPPDRDEEFIAHWERARDFLRPRPGYIDTALHQSLAPDAEFRFVNVARWRTPRDFHAATDAPEFPGREMGFTAHPALYQVVITDNPPGRAAPAEPVVLINLFEVPRTVEPDFMAGWKRARKLMSERPEYLGTGLHRSLTPDADFRFVNIARWASPRAFQAAISDPSFQEASAGIQQRTHPSLYRVVRQ